MVVEKKTTITPMTTDGKVIEEGALVIFEADGKCVAGIFAKITKRGSLEFTSVISNKSFCVMPTSINSIYLANISVVGELFGMNPPIEESEV